MFPYQYQPIINNNNTEIRMPSLGNMMTNELKINLTNFYRLKFDIPIYRMLIPNYIQNFNHYFFECSLANIEIDSLNLAYKNKEHENIKVIKKKLDPIISSMFKKYYDYSEVRFQINKEINSKHYNSKEILNIYKATDYLDDIYSVNTVGAKDLFKTNYNYWKDIKALYDKNNLINYPLIKSDSSESTSVHTGFE